MRSAITIMLDACRADHVSCYGYHKKTTPNIDKLASESLVFLNAHSCGSHTSTSLPTIFSGYPDAGRVGFAESRFPRPHTSQLSDSSRLLKELAKILEIFLRPLTKSIPSRTETLYLKSSLMPKFQREMTTYCITTNPFMHFGFQKGFDKFYPLWDALDKNSSVNPRLVTDKALKFIEKCRGSFFLYCHYLQPHYPYVAPFSKFKFTINDVKEYERLWWKEGEKLPESVIQKLIGAYDDNLRWADKEIEPLIQEGIKRRAIIVVTSDHGEEFGEHGGLFHKRYRNVLEATHVPLVLHGIGKGLVKKKFNLSKLLPMLMRILGIKETDEEFDNLQQLGHVGNSARRWT